MRQYYELKVSLSDTDPSVWRTFFIEPDVTMNVLHHVLQAVMGWTNSHTYVFRKEMTVISQPSRHDPVDSASTDLNASKVHLPEFLKRKGDFIEYTYDLGDSWDHIVELKEIVEHEDIHLALCTEGEKACPPEDCGGPSGYRELVNAMQDPDSEEYEETVEWLGEPFDPDHFDIDQTNVDLERLSAKYVRVHPVKVSVQEPVVQKKPEKQDSPVSKPVKAKPKKIAKPVKKKKK